MPAQCPVYLTGQLGQFAPAGATGAAHRGGNHLLGLVGLFPVQQDSGEPLDYGDIAGVVLKNLSKNLHRPIRHSRHRVEINQRQRDARRGARALQRLLKDLSCLVLPAQAL